jgi:hypothetical protein
MLADSVPDPGSWRVRRALGLFWLESELSEQDAPQLIDELVGACRSQATIYEEDAFGVVGNMLDVSDPLIYPWAHQRIYAAAALLTAPKHISVPARAQEIAQERLIADLDTHPGAAWLLSSRAASLSDKQRQLVMATRNEWKVRGALDAGYFDLTGRIMGRPPPAKKQHRKR